MRPRNHKLPITRFIIAALCLLFIIYMLGNSSLNPSPVKKPQASNQSNSDNSSTMAKLPRFLSQTLTHYATSATIPQQTIEEISVTERILERKAPCNFLVFGLGHDSLLWTALNFNGRTVFLEEDEAWIHQIKLQFPNFTAYHVKYNTRVSQQRGLIEAGKGEECRGIGDLRYSMCELVLKGLPTEVYEVEWDVIMVDAPTGYHEAAPGRMGAIYSAGMIGRNRRKGETDVLVHDVNREVEDLFSKEFLCEGYLEKQEGRLRHFVIPSHREDQDLPFCPL